ncbi:hypothetical protein J6590_108061, partial [Homalodisca vitripennis]
GGPIMTGPATMATPENALETEKAVLSIMETEFPLNEQHHNDKLELNASHKRKFTETE